MTPNPPAPEAFDRGPYAAFAGHMGTTLRDSTPWWPAPPRPPAGAPNVVLVLLDDLGYSDFGCFGAEIRTPVVDGLARDGLRFTGYTTVPMCTPARAALLTGKNPHSVGSGWLTANLPGYPGYQAGEISHDVPTMAELLGAAGYGTICVGKWHNTPTHLASPTAKRASWPTHRGFDRFYGFLAAEVSYFDPDYMVEGDEFIDHEASDASYYTTDAFADRAVRYLKQHLAADPERPFFLYFSQNAPHQPLHARPDDRHAYRGRYDHGWDALREERFRRQAELGIVDGRHRIPPHTPGVPDWDTLPADHRRMCARYMELYAAVVEAADRALGRVVAFLRAAGKLDDTLILVTSDNGANGVGGPLGNPNRTAMRYGFSLAPDDPRLLALVDDDRLGGPETGPAYPTGWAEVSNTPFRMFKRSTMNGGIRVPLVAHWPRGIRSPGAVAGDWVHVTDVLPTVLDAAGIPYPATFGGLDTRPVDGTSFAPLLADPTATVGRTRQHYELQGNRGLIRGRWKIVSLQPPDQEMDLANWMLFDLDADPSETRDLADDEPEVLRELVAAFEQDARANWVYPLDNRGPRRIPTLAPPMERLASTPRIFYAGTPTVPITAVAPLVADRDYVLRARFTAAAGDEGVIFALGEALAGYALYAMDGTLRFAVARWPEAATVVTTPPPEPGESVFEMRHTAHGGARGSARLTLDGRPWCEVDMSPTFARVGGGLDIGRDHGVHVSHEYRDRGAFAFTGSVAAVELVPGPQAPGSIVNLAERASQLS